MLPIPTSPETDTPPDDDDGGNGDPTPLWIVAAVIFGLAGIGGPILAILVFWLMRKYV